MIHRYKGRHAVGRAIKALSARARIGIASGMLAGLSVGMLMLATTTASAAVTFDPSSGTGFVGKGDVQTALAWNNAQLQASAGSVKFQSSSQTVTEVSWTCTNSNNENQQIRDRTTTTTTQGVVSSVARERNQITGFNLIGYTGTPTTTSSTEGPPLNSCPSGPWTLTTPAGDPQTISSSGQLQVSSDGTTWHTIYTF